MVHQTEEQLFVNLEAFANLIQFPVCWMDVDGVVVRANDAVLKSIGGFNIKDKIIGKKHVDIYPKNVADVLDANNKQVIDSGLAIEFEECTIDLTTGLSKYFSVFRVPLFCENKVVGVLITGIDITDKKELENLKIENQKHIAKAEENQKVLKFIESTLHSFQSFKMEILNDKLGTKPKPLQIGLEIKLTKREREILYFLSLNKSPKEIASILSTLENKQLSPLTISSIIDKQLYVKFGVNNVSKLIEVATQLKLIPFSITS